MSTPPTGHGRTIVRELAIAAPIERVFAAFVEPAALEAWFALGAELDPRPDGDFTFRWTNEHATGRVVAIDPPHRLVLAWDEPPPTQGRTTMTVTLRATSEGTLLHFEHSGFQAGPDWDALYDGVNEGWTQALNDLRDWLEVGELKANPFKES